MNARRALAALALLGLVTAPSLEGSALAKRRAATVRRHAPTRGAAHGRLRGKKVVARRGAHAAAIAAVDDDAEPAGANAAPPVAADANSPQAPQASMAAPRHVRPEAWIAESRYHDGAAPARVRVEAAHVALRSRPTDGAEVVGEARRGDQLVAVRASRDEKWLLVELGGGEVAWLPVAGARSLGAAPLAARVTVAPSSDDAPAPPALVPAPAAPAANAVAVVHAPPTARAAEPAVAPVAAVAPAERPAPPTRKAARTRKGHVAVATVDDDAREEAHPAHHDDSAATAGTSAVPDGDLALTTGLAPARRFVLSAAASAGASWLGQRFTSNAQGHLTNYEAETPALGGAVDLAVAIRLSPRLALGLAGAYRVAAAGGINVKTDAGPVTLAVQSHAVEARAALGYRLPFGDGIGGLTASAHLGGLLLLDLIDQRVEAPLPSQRVIGMELGVALDAPALWRGLGAHVEGSLLPVGDRAETGGLGEGAAGATWGYAVAGGLTWAFTPSLALQAAARTTSVATHFTGAAERNAAITAADRQGTITQLTVGLTFVR